jgi:hypothetical protein
MLLRRVQIVLLLELMSANNITQLCQKAAKAFLDSEDLSFITDEETQIVTGIAAGDFALPMVVCQCQQAESAVPYEGNWSAVLRIELRSNCNDVAADDHHTNAGELFGKFMTSVAAGRAFMSNEDLGFTAQQVTPVQQGWEVNDESWVSYLILQVECAGSYFSVA